MVHKNIAHKEAISTNVLIMTSANQMIYALKYGKLIHTMNAFIEIYSCGNAVFF